MPLLYIAHCPGCGERFGANHYGARCQTCGCDVIIDFRGEYPGPVNEGREESQHYNMNESFRRRTA